VFGDRPVLAAVLFFSLMSSNTDEKSAISVVTRKNIIIPIVIFILTNTGKGSIIKIPVKSPKNAYIKRLFLK